MYGIQYLLLLTLTGSFCGVVSYLLNILFKSCLREMTIWLRDLLAVAEKMSLSRSAMAKCFTKMCLCLLSPSKSSWREIKEEFYCLKPSKWHL